MSEELQKQAGGVPTETGTAPAGAVPGGVPAPGTAAPAQPATAEPRRINLDESEDFRRWKSQYDAKHKELARQAEAEKYARLKTQERLQELERQSARAQLANADPEQVAAFYEAEQKRIIEHYEGQHQQQEKQQQIVQRAYEFLERVGLDRQTPGLVWPENVDEAGLSQLQESAAMILALRAQTAQAATATEAQKAAQQARVETIQETGAAHVSTVTGGSSPGLMEEYKKRRDELKHSGRISEAIALKREFREKGLEI